ncbi:MAG TPA: sigma-70 family RNA polymerase sigma factor [Magnetospirillaceae bacterium]|nr:sigma-70 family RNA polymerase sigma factor [Magnetospirillaceae bacterium]
MPHEPAVRRWLARSRVPSDQIDDFIQEAYCKLSALPSVEHIQRPDAYFFQTVRSLVTEKIRQARIVSIETFTEIDSLPVLSDDPSPERIVAARRELAEVLRLIGELPVRCRQVVQLRKIEGLSQKEISLRLGITETMVENDVVKGMRLISGALKKNGTVDVVRRTLRIYGQARNRKRD